MDEKMTVINVKELDPPNTDQHGQGIPKIQEDADRFYDIEEVPSDMALRRKVRRKIMKNIILISLVFLLNFTAFTGLTNLQSSLHKVEGMGTITQSLLNGAMVLSSLFLPRLMISAIGHKWTMPICISGYILWMAANGYAVWGTMVTASIVAGICAAPLWTAQCTYFTKVAPKYAILSADTENTVVTRFFGIFFCLFQISSLIGSVISSTVLRPPRDRLGNESLTAEDVKQYCGANDCPWNNVSNPNQEKPDSKTLWTLVGIYIGLACISIVLVCTCVDNLPKYLQDDKSKVRQEAGQSAINTFLHLRNKTQCLLIPITIYSGLEQGFFWAEWNGSYVSCSIGIWMVGFVSIPAQAVNALTSLGTGQLVKYTGRIPVFTFGFVVHLTVQLTILLWPLDQNKSYAFFLLAATWGLTDGIWQTQINALYGVLFVNDSEAAFSNYRVWESVGFIISFAYSNILCIDVKLYIIMSVLVVGMVCYYVAEALEKKNSVKDLALVSEEQRGGTTSDSTQLDNDRTLRTKSGSENGGFSLDENGDMTTTITVASVDKHNTLCDRPPDIFSDQSGKYIESTFF